MKDDLFASTPPEKPGVYIYRDGRKRPIYIGKAKNLADRLASYRQKALPTKTMAMLDAAHSLEWIVFSNEMEALLAEASMIRHYKPKYNIMLRDDKRFPMVLITDEPYPKVMKVRRSRRGAGRHFGPFHGVTANLLIDIVSRNYNVRRCGGALPKRNRPCIDYDLGRCTGPCAGKVNRADYLRQVEDAVKFLSGEYFGFVREFEKEMKTAAARKEFELAAALRDEAQAMRELMEKQWVEKPHRDDADAAALSIGDALASVSILERRDGNVRERHSYLFELPLDAAEESVFLQAIIEHYSTAAVPKLLLVSESFDCGKAAAALCSVRSDTEKLAVRVPRRGADFRLLKLAGENAADALRIASGSRTNEKRNAALMELAELCDLEAPPRAIEAFDIATFAGKNTVGATVRFHDGVPWKAGYRKYRIKGREDSDIDAMSEMAERRAALNLDLPDIILVDGGMAQLHAVVSAVASSGKKMPTVISLEKKNETIRTIEGEIINPPRNSPALQLLQHLRDEAHRFCNVFQQTVMSRRIKKSL